MEIVVKMKGGEFGGFREDAWGCGQHVVLVRNGLALILAPS
jgi:hypothetical protein